MGWEVKKEGIDDSKMASDSCQIEEIRAGIKISKVPSRFPRNGRTNVPSQQLSQSKYKNSLDNNCMPGSELYTADSCGSLFCPSYFIQSLRFVGRNAKIRPDTQKKASAAQVRGRQRQTFVRLVFFFPPLGARCMLGTVVPEHCLASPVPRCLASSGASKRFLMFRASFEPNANLQSATARADSLSDAAKARFLRAAVAVAAPVVVGKNVLEARFIS